jgi:4a-hydroxytetrahydrobiopterin dehydratase
VPTALDETVVRARLTGPLARWRLEEGQLRRSYATQGWKSTMLAAGAVAHLAEAAWHHPELVLAWGKVEVRLWSHDAGGVTERDVALALKIEEVVGWRPADGVLEGTPDDPLHAYLLRDG